MILDYIAVAALRWHETWTW